LNKQESYSFINHRSFTPSFGFYKNIEELTTFVKDLLTKNEEIIPQSVWQKMFTIHHEVPGDEDDICFPWYKWKNTRVFEFNGYGFGSASSIIIDFDNKLAYTVLTNFGKEDYGTYFAATIRRFINYTKENKLNWNSELNGTYRGKDYDMYLCDFGDKIYMINLSDTTPFHPDNYSEYKKVGENKYLIDKKSEPCRNEFARFEFDQSGEVLNFIAGGWGFKKIDLSL